MEVSLVRTSLVNEPGNCGDIIPIVYELTKRTHEKNVRRLGTIIQSIFCAQSGASIHLTVWKWSGESRYPGALPPVLENFRRAFSPGPTDCPWVSEDESQWNNLVPRVSHLPAQAREERPWLGLVTCYLDN